MGTPWRRRNFPPGAWETAVMRQSVRQTRARRADRKSRAAIFYIERIQKPLSPSRCFPILPGRSEFIGATRSISKAASVR